MQSITNTKKMSLTEDQQFLLLKEEYFYLQKQCDEFDSRALTIKSWSVTVCISGIVAGLINNKPEIYIATAISAILFWLIEWYWKVFQYISYIRAIKIERYFNNKLDTKDKFRIPDVSGSWNYNYSTIKNKTRWKILFRMQVVLPYLIMAVSSILLYFFE
jgi:hypothetical protein